MDRDPWAAAVVIPARDEAAALASCLASVVAAADEAGAQHGVHIVVVADSCTDTTAGVAAAALAGMPASIVTAQVGNVGIARRIGARAAVRAWPSRPPGRTWIAMTDADTLVPRDWLRRQLDAARHGWCAVIGGIAVNDWSPRDPRLPWLLTRYETAQRQAGRAAVHGANLGVRADVLGVVGGVPALALAEDAALLDALDRAGVPVLHMADLVVRTSARRSWRAPGGFSSLLDRLETTP